MADKKLAQFRIDDLLRKITNKTLNGDTDHLCSLSLTERALLMALANHVRDSDECYPGQNYLAAYLGVTVITVKRTIKSLTRKLLLKSYKKPSSNKRYKYTRNNSYMFSSLIETYVTGITEIPVTSKKDVRQVSQRYQSRVIGIIQDMRQVSQRYPNRTIKRTNKQTERAREERAPHSLFNFLPDEKNIFLCKDLGLKLEEELATFKNRFQGKGKNLQFEFEQWIKNSKQHQRDRYHPQEIRSTVPEWGPGHPAYEERNRIYNSRKDDKPNGETPIVPIIPSHLSLVEQIRLGMENQSKEIKDDHYKANYNGRGRLS